jgi:hypothetical protein
MANATSPSADSVSVMKRGVKASSRSGIDSSLRTDLGQAGIGLSKLAASRQAHRLDERPCGAAVSRS